MITTVDCLIVEQQRFDNLNIVFFKKMILIVINYARKVKILLSKCSQVISTCAALLSRVTFASNDSGVVLGSKCGASVRTSRSASSKEYYQENLSIMTLNYNNRINF